MAAPYPPGPRDWLGLKTARDFGHDTLSFTEWVHREFGDIVSFRMGPYRSYLFFHPDQIRDLLVTHWSSFRKMKHQVNVMKQWDGNGLVLSEGEFWQRQHRLVQPSFSSKRIRDYAQVMVTRTERRLNRWRKRPSFELDSERNTLTMEIITECLFGSEVESRAKEIEAAVMHLSEIGVKEFQSPVSVPSWIPTSHNRCKAHAIRVLDGIIRGFIDERKRNPEMLKNRNDLLSTLIAASDPQLGRMTDTQARDEAMVLFLAGHDTTATALIWIFYHLGLHPAWQEKIVSEIRAVAGERTPQFEDCEKLVLLRAFIQETIRLYPPAIGVFGRENEREVSIGGYTIPKNSVVFTSSYTTHRDPRWFPDPLTFNPERFLGARVKEIPHFAYFPFGGGPRICTGMQFAMVEMALVVATVLQRYQLENEPNQVVEPKVMISLRPKNPIRVRVASRASP
ncbi:MAG: cytochrome P450, partial [Deltaproteobacteria bacterium]|nr:cytochrome P450 [Deltaproteobacteria bacterium]